MPELSPLRWAGGLLPCVGRARVSWMKFPGKLRVLGVDGEGTLVHLLLLSGWDGPAWLKKQNPDSGEAARHRGARLITNVLQDCGQVTTLAVTEARTVLLSPEHGLRG